jgi:hypothetical protein
MEADRRRGAALGKEAVDKEEETGTEDDRVGSVIVTRTVE